MMARAKLAVAAVLEQETFVQGNVTTCPKLLTCCVNPRGTVCSALQHACVEKRVKKIPV